MLSTSSTEIKLGNSDQEFCQDIFLELSPTPPFFVQKYALP
jgi:hypothetical protein